MKLHYFASVVLILIIFAFLVAKAGAANLTVTIDGQVVDVQGATIAITTVPEPPPIDPPPIDPPPIDPPPTGCNVTLSGVTQSWYGFWRHQWPGPKSWQITTGIPRNGYRALRFRTGNIVDSGLFKNFEATSSVGSRLIAISKCAGDFNVAPVCKRVVSADAGDIFWSTQNWSDPRYCYLDPNTTYYWNTTFTNGVDPDTGCKSQHCNTNLRVYNPG